MYHFFNAELAIEYGIEEAIIMEHFSFWIRKNEADGKHYHDGRFWTYGSLDSFTKIFPYMNSQKIKRVINSLVEQGILLKGNYNDTQYDRTLWYAFSDKALDHFDLIHLSKMTNGRVENDRPIPYINTDIYRETDISKDISKDPPKSSFVKPTVDEVRAYCIERGNTVDAEAFVDYYESNGWYVSHHKMKDWRAAVRTWEKRDNRKPTKKSASNDKPDWWIRYENGEE